MIEIATFVILGLLSSLIVYYIGSFLTKPPITDEINRIEIEYDSGQSAKVEITGELTGEQVEQLLKMIQEKLVPPPPEQSTVP